MGKCPVDKLALPVALAGAIITIVLFRKSQKTKPASFADKLAEAQAALGDAILSPAKAKGAISEPGVLILDVQDGPVGETIPNAINISLGTLPFKADASFADGKFKDSRLADDKHQPIVVTCALGGQALLAGKLLKDYGFTYVRVIDGGNKAWKEAGCPLRK